MPFSRIGQLRIPTLIFALIVPALLAMAVMTAPGAAAAAVSGNIVNSSSGLCLAPQGGAAYAGAALTVASCNNTASEQFRAAGSNLIGSGAAGQTTGLCISVSGVKTGSPVTLASCTSTASQMWVLQSNGSFVGLASGLCLAVKGGAATAGAPMVITTCNGKQGQAWNTAGTGIIVGIDTSTGTSPGTGTGTGTGTGASTAASGTLVNTASALCLSSARIGALSGTPLLLNTCISGNSDQQFVSGTSNTLLNNGLCLSVLTSGTYNLQLLTCGSSANQGWSTSSNGTIVNAQTGLCLTVNGTAELGVVVSRQSCTGSASQVWTAGAGTVPGTGSDTGTGTIPTLGCAGPTTGTGASTGGIATPAGYSASNLVFNDNFSESITNNWNFGLTDAATSSNGYIAWNQSGSLPCVGSGATSPFDAEYHMPSQISQTSTGNAYNNFSTGGNGLSMTAQYAPRTVNGTSYTWQSGSVNTYGKHAFGGFGTEINMIVRAKMACAVVNGQLTPNGAWNSIWMLPATLGFGGQEIDLQEGGFTAGSANPANVIQQNVHYADSTGKSMIQDTGVNLCSGYHNYQMDWNSATRTISFYFDGTLTQTVSNSGVPTAPMFLLLSNNVVTPAANSWHSPVQSTSGTMTMSVSNVQVYQKQG
ncbi:hypothetical protein FHU41_001579 [Psychromicrobium silvestre]|uniref:GH16 domain-containing protein n=1 Tax=Psychromicrobium silvestre TaxID=1645614 RepID=A0A7Y9S6D7_9MICC|nr:ricin-type beta-trefoil lectin domain protein [Psychromicrobium silvestre]NYE95358.1 hypothetical protein [Psychromicrobium silvestre]